MTKVCPWPLLCAAVMLSAGALAPAQTQDPEPPDPARETVVVHTVLADGSPMPGVPIVRAFGAPALVPADGWLRHVDDRLRAAAWPVLGRSDPEGRVVVLLVDVQLHDRAIRAGAPFQSDGLRCEGDKWLLRVTRLEQFVVQALDVHGAPLVDFPLALQRGGHDEALAVTDARGRATFGVDPGTPARLVVVPHGWLGPVDGFPTVASQLPGKHRVFHVPAFGRVRVRTAVGGVPKMAPIRGAGVRDAPSWSSRFDELTPFHGVEFGPVAVGQELRGELQLVGDRAPFAARAVARHGEIVVVDVDVEPPRPRFTLQLVVPGLRPVKSSSINGDGPLVSVNVDVLFHTEAGNCHETASADANGRLWIDPGRDGLRGSRVRRVDIDVLETEIGVASFPPERKHRTWSGTFAMDLAVTPVTHDLGTLQLEPCPGLLRGRVVDANGKPVVRAHIEVTAAGATQSPSASTDEAGEFELKRPLLRDAEGRPTMFVVTASLGNGPDTIHSEPSAPTAAGGDVTLVLQPPARGFLELTLRAPRALPRHVLQFAFVEANGRVRELGDGRVAWGGAHNATCRLGPIPHGRGALRIQLRPGVLLRTVADVEIAWPMNRDPRLADVDLSDVVTICRMRVVDEQCVPIAGSTVEYRGVSDQWGIGTSDAGGFVDIVKGPPKALRIFVSSPGKQPAELTEVVEGGDIPLRAMPFLCVTVKELPADVPRADLALFFRPVVRDNLRDATQARFDADDTVELPLPPPGLYHLRLTLRLPGDANSWMYVGQRDKDVLITRDADTLEFEVDAATLARLRELREKK